MNIGNNNMIKKTLLLGVFVVTLLLTSCEDKVTEHGVVNFLDREINIKSFHSEFPYTTYNIGMSKDGTKLFYQKNGETTDFMMLDLSVSTNLDEGVAICQEDFSKKNLWKNQYNSTDDCMYWMGDEKNDEIINIYRLNMGSGKIDRLTDVPYIYGWSMNEEGTKIAYIARVGQNEDRLDELHVLDLKTLEDKLVYTDKPDYRMTWSEISCQPDGNGATLTVLKDADRTYTNVAYVDFRTAKLKVITSPSKTGSHDGTKVISPWYSENIAYYISNQSGYANVYSYDKYRRRTKQITNYNFDIDAEWLTGKGKKYLVATSNSPLGSKVMIINPKTGKEIASESFSADIRITTVNENKVFLSVGAVDVIYQIWSITYANGKLTKEVVLELPEIKNEKLVRSTVERLSIPTFDIDENTNKTREIHAYLMTPKKPLPKGKERVMIMAFYGGGNSYDLEHQIFADAGIHVLSPSPRGASGFGRDFAALNDKDLGGNEIIDIIQCAKYISEKLGIPAERIGVFGMSHGGYATMRLMTFPGEVNQNKASFPFGFGVAVAGFADIIYQHNNSNIPDWTFLEAGDPVADQAKLIDRSPITHVDKITGPLLLIHGNHDDRVSIHGSQVIYDALINIGKPVEFLEVEGQGHGFKGIDNNILYYTAIFDFLEGLQK